jgi:hypothetical protein
MFLSRGMPPEVAVVLIKRFADLIEKTFHVRR